MNKTIISLILTAAFLVVSTGISAQETKPAEQAVTVKEIQPFIYSCIHKKGPFSLISQTIGEFWLAMQKQGIQPTGTMFGIYFNAPGQVKPEDLEWEIGAPVSSVPKPEPPLEKKEWKFTHVASAIHSGPYEEVGQTFEKIMKWIFANGYVPAGPPLERYLTDPGMVSDPKDNKTEIWIPVKKK